MNRGAAAAFVLALVLPGLSASASEGSHYSGEQTREIKALSDSDIAGLLSGKGMGYARAAELNGYPGPAHVLELARELELTAEQRSETQAVFAQMQSSAKELGADLVAAERALDQAFKDSTIDESSLAELVTKIGGIESRLRAVHLKAHLRQARVLDHSQIEKYMMLRGYRDDEHGNHQNHQHGG